VSSTPMPMLCHSTASKPRLAVDLPAALVDFWRGNLQQHCSAGEVGFWRAIAFLLVTKEQFTPGANLSARTRQICRLSSLTAAGHDVEMPNKAETVVAANIASQIRVVRGQRVLLDSDLATLYTIPTHRFN
jgi:hypothetical protein